MAQNELVILVDALDRELGTMDKLEAHQKGLLHRAISVFVFNEKNEMLLQRRALEKYHSAGLWTNACCSHPRPGESAQEAAIRRAQEEIGLSLQELTLETKYLYQCVFENGLTEYELDYLFVTTSSLQPLPDASEVMDWRWVTKENLQKELNHHPSQFTFWFKSIMADGLIQFPNPVPGNSDL